MNLLRPGDRQILLNAAKAMPFELLMAFLKLYGTPIVFAPYYDASRTSTRTYDLNGGGDYLTLSGAIFDATNYQAMKFDGVDDYALGNVSRSSASTVAFSAGVLHVSAEDRNQRIFMWGLLNGTSRCFQFYDYLLTTERNTFGGYDSGGSLVPVIVNGTTYVPSRFLFGNNNTTNNIARYNATDGSAVSMPTINNINQPLNLSSTSLFLKGSTHLALAFAPSQTIAQADALWAQRATLYTLVKAAFPWVSLP